jgi:hypothetical protein
VKNHDFSQKMIFFPILGGGRRVRPLGSAPAFDYIAPKTLNYFAFQTFVFKRT